MLRPVHKLIDRVVGQDGKGKLASIFAFNSICVIVLELGDIQVQRALAGRLHTANVVRFDLAVFVASVAISIVAVIANLVRN
jgi:hypothetical protein